MRLEMTILGLSSTILSLAIGYAFWARIRILRLQVRQTEVMLDLRDQMSGIGALDDPAYLRAKSFMLAALRRAYFNSVPMTFYMMIKTSTHKPELPGTSLVTSEDPKVTKILQESIKKFTLQAVESNFRETLCGWGVYLALKTAAPLSREEIREGASIIIGPAESPPLFKSMETTLAA